MTTELPPVSIVILTYNGSRFIRGLLSSLRDQTYPRYLMEVIVVDNGSQDNTVSLVRGNFPEVTCIALSKNVGFAAGNNVGYRHSKMDLVIFLNQDTICHRNWLTNLVIPMLVDQKVAACVSNIIPTDPGNAPQVDRNSPVDTLFFCDIHPFGYGRYYAIRESPIIQTLLVSGCSFIIRREVVEELGYLFDQRLWMYAEDTDLSLRILGLGKKVFAIRDSIVFHLHGTDFRLEEGGFKKAFGAIHNRVWVYLKNMQPMEFMLFFPLLVLGGGGKLLELRMSPARKALFFLPFSVFSCTAMMLALVTNVWPVFKQRRFVGQESTTPKKLIRQLWNHDHQ